MVRSEGLIIITYDQDIIYNDQEISGYYFCCTEYDLCDDKSGLEWRELAKVSDIGSNFVSISNLESFDS